MAISTESKKLLEARKIRLGNENQVIPFEFSFKGVSRRKKSTVVLDETVSAKEKDAENLKILSKW